MKHADGLITQHSNSNRMNGGKHPGFLRRKKIRQDPDRFKAVLTVA